MFTGIIEEVATVHHLEKENDNLHLTIKANFTSELKIDQSVALIQGHNQQTSRSC